MSQATELDLKGFQETSFLDWDGKIVSTLYVPGCNFRCPFCHNFGLIEKPADYPSIPLSHIEQFLLEHRDFIDGICLTGGEPCLHKNHGLFALIEHIKELGFQVKLDTNGSEPDVLQEIIDRHLSDYIAMDVKGPLDERYNKLAGIKVDLAKIKQSIDLIMKSGINYEFRTSVVPTLLATKDIQDMATALRGAKKWVLQQFSPLNTWDKHLREVTPYTKEKLEEMVEIAKPYIPNTMIRGV